MQTQRLAKSFEGLNSSLAQSLVEIFLCKNTCKLLDISPSLLERNVLRCFRDPIGVPRIENHYTTGL